jgi:hypothetical protein
MEGQTVSACRLHNVLIATVELYLKGKQKNTVTEGKYLTLQQEAALPVFLKFP